LGALRSNPEPCHLLGASGTSSALRGAKPGALLELKGGVGSNGGPLSVLSALGMADATPKGVYGFSEPQPSQADTPHAALAKSPINSVRSSLNA
jgi:hypothetical protein